MTDIINSKAFSFTNTEDAFNECTRITNLKTGVTEFLSPDDKQFYVRMRHRYYYFVRELGRSYYDDVDQLGQSIGVSPATATRIVARLRKVGLIASVKPKRSNQWTITDITPENFLFERDANATKRKTAPEWVDCLKHPVFGKAKEDVAPEAEEEKHQSVPEEAKAEPKPTKKPASIPAKEIKIEAVNPVSIGLYRDEWENPDKNLPVSQHPKIRWLLINGYLDTEKNPKLKTIYEEIKHLC
ncbi:MULTISPECIES: winged helix-turn-helix domain-containing protein [Enterobacteriaceae]|uniref:winged helix-turn-helix domain-containing protein n=1 Tax=Enterobacteriaceae TaxID=543 RepID=UPI0012A7E977|nr:MULTISPECIES: winged helix-turn-helix domain-containing protein [Enterobacteriaceae]HBQ6591857.1 winged helix-turn-helix transcriptional regulator [Klebsiella quasipneumoniae subsp. similipneumoniae]HCM9568411.1 winged helix-turn-helix transcriptional regulator [Enterobacter bugandensis]MBZ7602955.1 winged helix-turn-helix transcriptional regulator [Klebsiella michiganensis]QGJ42473.1 ArsR family transcriptional regulator [Citrobacter freundii]QGJ44467.1 ArsR family transcriptional regulato